MVCLAAAACGPKNQVVRLVAALPLTGDLGSEGQGVLRGVVMAVEQANAAKKLPFRVEVVAFDDRGDSREAENVAHLIVADPRVAAVVGHYSSDCSARAARVYARAGVAMISPASTNPELTLQQSRPDWPGPRVAFRLVPTDDAQGRLAARFLRFRLGRRRVAVAHDGTLYGRGLAEEFKRAFVRFGGKVAAEVAVTVGSRRPSAAAAALSAARPDAIFFGGRYPEAGLILKETRRLGLQAVFCSGDGTRTPHFFDVAGEAADGAYLTMAGVPVEELPRARDFLAAYRNRFGASEEVKPFDHYGYEGAWVILDALARAGTDRARVLAAVRRTRREGLLGTISFDENGDSRDKTVRMTRADFQSRTFPVIHF
ncbi:MAG: branched-chain amino acid ABC transporter substrate-binding protein [Elusimicrobia bacterium]|nr:branched-chain amino acid ABC transporter substrate-binding protein [Elusimicrobiota bacterium]